MENFLKKKYQNIDGILSFEIKDSETNKVTNFYKETPFPNYKENDDRQTILEKGNKNLVCGITIDGISIYDAGLLFKKYQYLYNEKEARNKKIKD